VDARIKSTAVRFKFNPYGMTAVNAASILKLDTNKNEWVRAGAPDGAPEIRSYSFSFVSNLPMSNAESIFPSSTCR
jgi:hypothetical protein